MVYSGERGWTSQGKNLEAKEKGPLRMHTGLWKTVVALALLNLPVMARQQ
jgi:hypothetical protein